MSRWRAIRSDWRKFRHLTGWERAEHVEAAVVLVRVFLRLRLTSIGRTRAVLERRARRLGGRSPADASDQAARVARVVEAVGRRCPFRVRCLERSVSLWWMLARRGIRSELKIGVQTEKQELEAHAWVEHRGEPLGCDREIAARYHPFAKPVISS